MLSKTTTVMSRDLKNLLNTTKTVSSGMNKALGAVGLGLTFAALGAELKKATQAAVDDRKQQGLLAQSLRNTVNANAEVIAGAEAYVKATQFKTNVLDDNLRPALALAVRATGSLTKGEQLLNTALDVSAGTTRDLQSVTIAMTKAYAGNSGALKKLGVNIKDGTDFMGQLDAAFKGSAETAANLDPYSRLQLVFQDMQETIGAALLPALDQFAQYLVSPDGQRNLQQIIDLFVGIGKAISAGTAFLMEHINELRAIIATLIVLRTGWGVAITLVTLYVNVTKNAVTATKLLKVALATTGIGALVVGVGLLAEGWMNAADAKNQYDNINLADTMDPATAFWFDERNFEKIKKLVPDFIAYSSDAWMKLGYETYGAYVQGVKDAYEKNKSVQQKINDQIAAGADKMKKTAERFRDSIGLAFGTVGKDENSVFNANMVIDKLKRRVDAAKGFAENLRKLRKAGAGQDVQNELIAMGPAQGNIVAKGLLSSGRLSEYLGLRGSLYGTGSSVQSVANNSSNASYTINLNKSNVSAQDIINAITAYEKKTGRKYFAQ
jgi:hypothetical protein